MPSSTSSSERRIPEVRWGTIWIVAILLAALGTWRLEQLTRDHGHRASVVDDPFLWSLTRRQIDDDPRIVAFLGASRMALGYAPEAFAEAAPELRGIQLSINDYLPFETLRDLADDEAFRGVAVIDFIETEVADPLPTDSAPYVERARTLWRAPGALANRFLAGFVQERLAVLTVTGRRIVMAVVGKRQWPDPRWFSIERDRTVRGDYHGLAPPAQLRQRSERRVAALGPPLPPDAWIAVLLRELEPMVAKIRARGGDVAIVHTPVSGLLASTIDARYPRAQYWDAFAARSSAHVIHFRDVPAMAGLVCPDDMHLDMRDQAAFTRALVEVLRQRGALRNR